MCWNWLGMQMKSLVVNQHLILKKMTALLFWANMSFFRVLVSAMLLLQLPCAFINAQNHQSSPSVDSLKADNAKAPNNFFPWAARNNNHFFDQYVHVNGVLRSAGNASLRSENSSGCNTNVPRVILDQPNVNQYCGTIAKTKDGNMLIPGWYDKHWDDVDAPSTGCLIKCNMQGDIIWAKHILSIFSKNCFYFKVIESADNSIYITGLQSVYDESHHATYNNLIVLKLDKNGELLWSKTFTCTEYKDGDNTNMLDVYQLAEDKIGNIYITGTLRNSMPTNAFVLKLSAKGNILWSKIFGMSQITYGYGVSFSGNHVILIAGTDYNNYFGVITAALTLQENDGKLIDEKIFSPSSNTPEYSLWANHVYVTELDNGNIALAGRLFNDDFLNSNGTTLYSGMVEFTKELSYVKGYKLSGTYLTNGQETKITVHPDESMDYTFLNYDNRLTGLNIVFGRIRDGKISRERLLNYPSLGNSSSYNALPLPNDGNIRVLQPMQQGKYGKFELLTLFNSDVPDKCTGIDTGFATVLPFNLKVINPIPVNETSGIIIESGLNSFYVEDDKLTKYQGCSIKAACDSFKIRNISANTCVGGTLDVLYYKNKACTSNIIWAYDSTAVSIGTVLNDSIARFNVKKQWKGYIKATIPGCAPLTDSLLVSIGKSATSVNLGKDTSLCKDATYTINAKAGYQSYLWQDGSADSSFTAIQPGKYYVKVKDFCDNIKTDTLNINPIPLITLGFQTQYSKCNTDTLSIHLPTEISTVLFNPSNNISYNNKIIQAAPVVSTVYNIQAITTQGCLLRDTFAVKVNSLTPIDLGKDTAICEGSQLELVAPPGFESYLWSDGNIHNKDIISTGGTYVIKATDINHCISSDTIIVIQNSNPVISLGADRKICMGQSLILSPGTSFISYLWQDGAITPTYTAFNPGTYTVNIVDKNNCRGHTSMQILGYYDAPAANFLDKTDSICNFSYKYLSVKGAWGSYLWSNGATSPGITVSAPGMYWVNIKNNEGCSATDTIQLYPKECVTGVYFPSAFTPNGDGKNDNFKPLIYAPLDTYYFVIYNRFGEKVFETKDDRKSWDGKKQGLSQDTATYIWYCLYKIKGQQEKSAKGTVLLLH